MRLLKIYFFVIMISNCFGLNLYRRFEYRDNEGGTVLGTPSEVHHLPEAEPVMPGHTLIRPAVGMLKSAVKFPHKDLDSGSGVYGNMDNLGISYDGRNERVLYSGFRRSGLQSPKLLLFISPKRSYPDEKQKSRRILLKNIISALEIALNDTAANKIEDR